MKIATSDPYLPHRNTISRRLKRCPHFENGRIFTNAKTVQPKKHIALAKLFSRGISNIKHTLMPSGRAVHPGRSSG